MSRGQASIHVSPMRKEDPKQLWSYPGLHDSHCLSIIQGHGPPGYFQNSTMVNAKRPPCSSHQLSRKCQICQHLVRQRHSEEEMKLVKIQGSLHQCSGLRLPGFSSKMKLFCLIPPATKKEVQYLRGFFRYGKWHISHLCTLLHPVYLLGSTSGQLGLGSEQEGSPASMGSASALTELLV